MKSTRFTLDKYQGLNIQQRRNHEVEPHDSKPQRFAQYGGNILKQFLERNHPHTMIN